MTKQEWQQWIAAEGARNAENANRNRLASYADRPALFGSLRHNEPRLVNLDREHPRMRDDRNLQSQRDAQLARYQNGGF